MKFWRITFVSVLMILGGYSGFQIGDAVVKSVKNLDPKDIKGNAFLSSYQDILNSPSGSTTAFIAFTLLGLLLSFLVATGAFNKLVKTGDQLQEMSPNEKVATFLGVTLGLLLTVLLSPILLSIKGIGVGLTVLVAIALVYLGVVTMTSMKDDIKFFLPGGQQSEAAEIVPERCKILDTNVIIDGRVADICRAGFLEGPIYVPGFVLDELQHIADSADSLKRARGRRGLDILNQMRTELKMLVRTYDNTDPNDRDEVDAKLVKLAKQLDGCIVTNDFNLNKVAELQGVTVLNINELANALKPVVLPGEEMTVTIIKEGKEMNQGVAYLDDGTMIVVEGARRRIGETLDVVTSSVLQTVAGKMIFASIRNSHGDEEEESYDPNSRGYPRSGPRRKIQY
ncbi:MAG: PIN domain-containing protein [Capsulimonas sp.]|uniref:PIN/TRAM domain-containing protein n=1 Tax=Capsulimonas sp. TaxID=2494211 RepID=UPI003266B6C5